MINFRRHNFFKLDLDLKKLCFVAGQLTLCQNMYKFLEKSNLN